MEKGEKVRVIVQVKRVWLAVRFNCKLSFIIKNELAEKVAEIDETHSLFRGECLVNQTMSFELSYELLTTRCKKLKLIVMMISANGMVPAGFVTFSTRPEPLYELNECILPLERCQDSRAQIKFMHMYELPAKTPLEKSYISMLSSKDALNRFDLLGALSKMHPKSSHSLNRENLSPRKTRHRETIQIQKVGQANFHQGLVSPRELLRTPDAQAADNSVRRNDFPISLAGEKKQESSIFHLSREQLLKEHQEYWLQIVRMEEEMQALKVKLERVQEENKRLEQQGMSSKEQADTIKEYYEGHEEKIHAFLGQLQQNSQTIQKLERQLQENIALLSQKEQFERECQELLHLQEGQLRQHLNKIADMQEKLSACEEEKQQRVKKGELDSQTILFLQNQLLGKEKKEAELVERLSFLEMSCNQLQQEKSSLNNTLTLLRQEIKQYTNHLQSIPVLQYDNISLQQSPTKDHQISQSIVFQHGIQSSLERQAPALGQLHELKKIYDVLAQSSSLEQSRIKIMQSQLSFCQKDRQTLRLEDKIKDQKISELQLALESLENESKVIQLQLIQLEAVVTGKERTILEIRHQLTLLDQKKEQVQAKCLSVQSQLQKIESLLSKEEEEKNKLSSVLAALEEKFKHQQQEKAALECHLNQAIASNENLICEISELKMRLQLTESDWSKKRDALRSQHEEQLNLLEQKYSNLEQQYGQALQSLEELKRSPRKSIHDQYQGSYSLSVTAVTLQLAKVEQMLADTQEKLNKEATEKQEYSRLLEEKEAEHIKLKSFTQEKLFEIIKAGRDLNQHKQRCSDYQRAVWLLSQQCQDLEATNKDLLLKIDQLASQLQFVTQILQRERQEKSDIERKVQREQERELPSIIEVAQLKQESLEEGRSSEEVILEIESKLTPPSDVSKEPTKEDVSRKKKKKR